MEFNTSSKALDHLDENILFDIHFKGFALAILMAAIGCFFGGVAHYLNLGFHYWWVMAFGMSSTVLMAYLVWRAWKKHRCDIELQIAAWLIYFTFLGLVFLTGGIESGLFPMMIAGPCVIGIMFRLRIVFVSFLASVASIGIMVVLNKFNLLDTGYFEGNEVFKRTGYIVSVFEMLGFTTALALIRTTQQKQVQDALIIKTEEAIQANKIRSALLANVNHELRTPLNGVIGSSQLLKTKSLGSEERKLVSTIEDSGKSLLHMVDKLIEISDLTSSKRPLKLKPTSIYNLLQEAKNTVSVDMKAENFELTIKLDPSAVGNFLIDASHLRQVLINLLSNAVKFTKQGRGLMTARYHNSWLYFEVEDSGPGIPEADRERVFERFTQLNKQTGSNNNGIGLGLAIVKEIITSMNGEIYVDSSPLGGARFNIRIPAHPL